MAKHKKKDKSNHKKRVTEEYTKQLSLLVKKENTKKKLPLHNENSKEDTEDDLQIVDEFKTNKTTLQTEIEQYEVKREKQGSSSQEIPADSKRGSLSSTETEKFQVKCKKQGSSSLEVPGGSKPRSRSTSASSSLSSSSNSDVSSSTISSSSSSTTSSSSTSREQKKKKKKGKRSKKSKRSRKAKKYGKNKSQKISSKKGSGTSPNLYTHYNKVAGQPIGKQERKVLHEATAGFKPYPKTSGSTKKKEEAVIRGRKGKKRTFFCLPHALSESVPPFREWTRLIGYGVGQKAIQVYNDASSEELIETLYREFPALNGVQFSYGKAKNGLFSDDYIIDNSANMATLKSAIGCTGDIFIIPHQDLLLPTDPVGISKVKCPDCGEDVLNCDSREHAATHLRDDTFFRPEGAKKTYLDKVRNKVGAGGLFGKGRNKDDAGGSSEKVGIKDDNGGSFGKVGNQDNVGGTDSDVEIA